MKTKQPLLIISITFVFLLACQALTQQLPGNELSSVTATPQATPTLEPITEKTLAGLIVQSPTFGSGPGPYMGDYPIFGLGIVNQEGQLIEFAESGQMVGYSRSSPYIVYQAFDYSSGGNGRLRSFNVETGETININDDLNGNKNIITWLPDAPSRFIYKNDLEAYLFEAYGYFEGEEILLADASNGDVSLLLEHTFQSTISPDQAAIAYTAGELMYGQADNTQEGAGCFHPYMYDIGTLTSTPVDLSSLSETPTCVGYPQWSPDGKTIAWDGYFGNQTFRLILFDVETGNGKIYGEIPGYTGGSQFPSGWNMDQAPFWIDENTIWTANYEINIKTGETSSPREVPKDDGEYVPKPISRNDGRLTASLNPEGIVEIKDLNDQLLASYALEDIYIGDKSNANFTSEQYRTYIIDWSPFAPPGGVVSIIPTPEPSPTSPPPAFTCKGAPRARLQIGDVGRVTFTDGTKTILRSSPETNAGDNTIDRLPEGTEFEVIGGPVCYPRPGRRDAYVYWEIKVPTRNNKTGWAAEGDQNTYYIEPWR